LDVESLKWQNFDFRFSIFDWKSQRRDAESAEERRGWQENGWQKDYDKDCDWKEGPAHCDLWEDDEA
jgi:hypothetical protein